jgi:hypothetical protein
MGLWSNLEWDYEYYEWLAALTKHSKPEVQLHAMQETMASMSVSILLQIPRNQKAINLWGHFIFSKQNIHTVKRRH